MLLTGHFKEVRQYRTVRPHGSSDWLMILTLGGAASYIHARGSTLATRGSLVVMKPGTPHNYGTADLPGHWELLWAHFQPRPHWHDLLGWPEIVPGVMSLQLTESNFAEATELFGHAHRRATSGERQATLHAMVALEQLLLLCDEINPKSARTGVDSRVAAAVEHICSHLSNDLTVEEVARTVFSSPSRLAHLFKTHTGMSVQQYIEAQRLERAKQLLGMTSRSVQAISADVGFASPFYFSLRFKKFTGMSPTEYRAKNLNL